MIFSNNNRTYTGIPDYAEPQYDYLNRSARVEAKRIRGVLETWFSRHPDKEKKEFCSRIKSSDDISFLSATFELYLHELFLRLGYSIVVHPPLEGTNRQPDFLITDTEGHSNYVEATLAMEKSKKDRGAEKRTNVVFDTINKLECPDFFLVLQLKSDPKEPPSGKRLNNELATWLGTLDVDEVAEHLAEEGDKSLPKYDYNQDGWQIQFTAIPKSPENRGNPDCRPIGSFGKGLRHLSIRESILKVVTKKGSSYGNPNRPFIVVVNAGNFFINKNHEMEALFGEEVIVVPCGESTSEPSLDRKTNGVWRGPKGPQYTRISGVLIVPDIGPWSLAERNIRLYHNPWGTHPFQGPICKINQGIVGKNDQMEWIDGVHPREILELYEGWPEDKIIKKD